MWNAHKHSWAKEKDASLYVMHQIRFSSRYVKMINFVIKIIN